MKCKYCGEEFSVPEEVYSLEKEVVVEVCPVCGVELE
jgi:hypothetical protein